jgi:hypothetical protein
MKPGSHHQYHEFSYPSINSTFNVMRTVSHCQLLHTM